jgi:hypothetical protein
VGEPLHLTNLGDLGVDRVTSPLHQPQGSWLALQNAEFSNIEGHHGVKKRGALRRLNAEALNGGANILVLANMPLSTDALVAPTEGPIFAALSGGGALVSSDLGGAFSAPAGLTSVVSKFVVLHGAAYGISGAPHIVKWSATAESTEVNTITDFPSMTGGTVVDLVTDGTELWALCYDNTFGAGVARVYHWAPGTSPVQYGSDIPISSTAVDGTLGNVSGLGVLAGVAYVQADLIVDHVAGVLHGAYLKGPTFAALDDAYAGSGAAEYAQTRGPIFIVNGKAVALAFHGPMPFTTAETYTTADGTTPNTIAGTGPFDDGAANGVDLALIIGALTGGDIAVYRSTDGTTWVLDENLTSALGVTQDAGVHGSIVVGQTYSLAVVFDGTNWQIARRLNSTGVWDLAPGVPAGQTIVGVGI